VGLSASPALRPLARTTGPCTPDRRAWPWRASGDLA
jgi:hypothetical protein